MTPQDLPNQDRPMQERVQQAVQYFRQGYNCSQSVAMAFADLYGIEPETMARLAASFGGGIGRMRETCGAASGMFLLAGLETTDGSPDPDKPLTLVTGKAASTDSKIIQLSTLDQVKTQYHNKKK